jgi:hypothetical protein
MAVEMPGFEVPQIYETVIAMRDRGGELYCEFWFACVPVAAIYEGYRALLEDPQELLSLLGLAEPGELQELQMAQLPDAIFTLLRAEELGEDTGPLLDQVSDSGWLAGQREADPDAALFAEYLAFAEVVPFEQSKPSFSSFASLMMKSGVPAGGGVTLAGVPLILTSHGAILFLAAAGAALTPAAGVLAAVSGSVLVVDGVGVVVGKVAKSPRTAGAVQRARHGLRRLIHGPVLPEQDPGDQQAQEEAQRLVQQAQEEAQRLAEAAQRHEEALDDLRAKARRRKPTIKPTPKEQ